MRQARGGREGWARAKPGNRLVVYKKENLKVNYIVSYFLFFFDASVKIAYEVNSSIGYTNVIWGHSSVTQHSVGVGGVKFP